MLLVAGSPIVVTIALVAARRSSMIAAVAGLVTALLGCCLAFPLPHSTAVLAQWVPVLAEVLAIIFGGLLLSEAMRLTGRQAVLARWLEGALGTGPAAALAIVHGVTPFAESVTGFGIGVTVSIPLLLHLGFSSRDASVIGLLGLCAVPWGSMGPGTLIAANLSGTGFRALGVASAIASGPVFLGVGLATVWMTTRGARRRPLLLQATLSGTALWGSVLIANLLVGTPAAGALGALTTLLLHLLVHRVRGARIRMSRAVAAAACPYLVLLGGILLTTAVLAATRQSSGPWRYLASPAIWLPLAVVPTTSRSVLGKIARVSSRRWVHAGPVTGVFLCLGIVMAVSGMSEALAQAASRAGPGYVFLLGLVAALGGYLTGSNSASNAMFAGPQSQIIHLLGLPGLAAMAVHNVCSSLTLMASPAKIELAAQLCPQHDQARAGARIVLTTDLAIVTTLTLALALLLIC